MASGGKRERERGQSGDAGESESERERMVGGWVCPRGERNRDGGGGGFARVREMER